jgi:hypothetical protein
MKRPFKIKSPSGKTIEVTAETIYEACEIARRKETWAYSNAEYLKLNKGKK